MRIFKFNKATLLLQKLQWLFTYIGHLLSLFPSGSFKLKLTFGHFHNYIFYKHPSPHFEKPACVLFRKYRRLPLSLHLSQWQLTKQLTSLIQLRYTQIKRNPE